jgi:NDP-sugar pyrophosphorylase family protein
MSNRALALLAGGYSEKGVQKHLIKNAKTGNYLFEDIIAAVPANTVYVVTNRIYLSFWQKWWVAVTNKETGRFKDKAITIFLDTQNAKGMVNNPSLWMTSGIASLCMNREIDEVVYSAIDSYYENFDFIDEFIKQTDVIVVAQSPSLTKFGTPVAVDWLGKFKEFDTTQPSTWIWTSMMKTTTKNLLVQGTLSKGSMSDVIKRMISKGTEFKTTKTNGAFFDVGTTEQLNSLKGIGLVCN